MGTWVHGDIDTCIGTWVCMDTWGHVCMGHEYIGTWIHGDMDTWVNVCMDTCVHGDMETCVHGYLNLLTLHTAVRLGG